MHQPGEPGELIALKLNILLARWIFFSWFSCNPKLLKECCVCHEILPRRVAALQARQHCHVRVSSWTPANPSAGNVPFGKDPGHDVGGHSSTSSPAGVHPGARWDVGTEANPHPAPEPRCSGHVPG